MYKYLIISLFLCSFIGVKEYSAQYRDPFSEKVLTEEWNKLSSQIEEYESSSTPKN